MNDLNVVVISGRLTRDPVHRTTPEGEPVAVFRIVQHHGKASEHLYIDAEAAGEKAEVILNYFKKGDPILLRGRLRLGERDGHHGRHIEIDADQISFYSKARRPAEEGGVETAETAP